MKELDLIHFKIEMLEKVEFNNIEELKIKENNLSEWILIYIMVIIKIEHTQQKKLRMRNI